MDLIFTDPPYHREFVPQYEELAEWGERVKAIGGVE